MEKVNEIAGSSRLWFYLLGVHVYMYVLVHTTWRGEQKTVRGNESSH